MIMPPRLFPNLVSVFLLLFAAAVPVARAAETPAGAMTERHRAFLETNCQSCHGPEKQKGRFRVDELPAGPDRLPLTDAWAMLLPVTPGPMPAVTFTLDVATATELIAELRVS